jgi:hypothetical protein
MDAATDPGQPRYSAFISYSHEDAAFVRRLHARLESYRLPRRLSAAARAGRSRLAPLFVDRAELSAAPSLTQSIRDAIAGSDALIVVCSPDAAASHWVDQEIRLFRELRPSGPILTAICRGDAADAFPGALLGDDR